VFPSTWETFGLAAAEAAMTGMPMIVADLPVLREVLHADGSEPVTFVAPQNVEGWIAAIGKALVAPPAPYVVSGFARAIGRKYSRQRMIESYLSLFGAYRRLDRREVSGLQPATEEF
jgi:glycosyltransferase involved in cell wall biosynthesis